MEQLLLLSREELYHTVILGLMAKHFPEMLLAQILQQL